MGNLRIPRMRISALHVEGMLRLLDQRAAVLPAPTPPTLRYPQDFPGARATGGCRTCGEGELPLPEQNICPPCQLQADVQTVADHGNDADVMIEIDAQHEEARAAMIESAIALDEGEGALSILAQPEALTIALPPPPHLRIAPKRPARGGPVDPKSIVTFPAPPSWPLPPDPLAARRAMLEKAIAWLKRERCILVTVADRDHAIRAYRITGRRGLFLAEDVIDEARRQGFDG